MQDESDADLFVYLDPDVYVYNDLAAADGYLGDSSIGLVPHILTVETTDIGVQMTEMSVTEHGIYNLGHLFVRPDENGRALARWWADRLDKYCFRSEEHTSELQSLMRISYAVCCLKKKKNKTQATSY